MRLIEPHIHMICRTTEDYELLQLSQVAAVTEPAFWAGYDRSSALAFHDYFTHITACEPLRAAKYGIQHYAWICMNCKEAENLTLAREVMQFIPEFLARPNVLGVGEIGLNLNTRNEMTVFAEQVELALRYQQLILIHTPHMKDKLKGTRMIVDYLQGHGGVNPDRVLIDHAEEQTIGLIRDAGFWCGITLYPVTKTSAPRAVDMLEIYGLERVWLSSSADWGPSSPRTYLAVLLEMRRRGFSEAEIQQIGYANPCRFLSQSPHFRPPAG